MIWASRLSRPRSSARAGGLGPSRTTAPRWSPWRPWLCLASGCGCTSAFGPKRPGPSWMPPAARGPWRLRRSTAKRTGRFLPGTWTRRWRGGRASTWRPPSRSRPLSLRRFRRNQSQASGSGSGTPRSRGPYPQLSAARAGGSWSLRTFPGARTWSAKWRLLHWSPGAWRDPFRTRRSASWHRRRCGKTWKKSNQTLQIPLPQPLTPQRIFYASSEICCSITRLTGRSQLRRVVPHRVYGAGWQESCSNAWPWHLRALVKTCVAFLFTSGLLLDLPYRRQNPFGLQAGPLILRFKALAFVRPQALWFAVCVRGVTLATCQRPSKLDWVVVETLLGLQN